MKTKYLILLIVLLKVIFTCNLHAQIITTIAGTGTVGYNGDGIQATASELHNAPRITLDGCGNVYIADGLNQRVRKVDVVTGIITTVAGTGIAGFSGDGIPAIGSQLNRPNDLAFDNMGNLYIGDADNDRIRKVDAATGIISTYVGTGIVGFSGEGGPATAAMINAGDMAFDPFGNMYMCDLYRIRKITPAGIITTIAGTGLPGPTTLNVPATSTSVHPYPAIATDIAGNVYTVDSPGVILKIDMSTGILSKVAGSGVAIGPYTGDDIAATSCNMNPAGICLDSAGNIYAACYTNNRCIAIDTSGITHTIAGTGIAGFGGDSGSATSAQLWYPKDIAFDHIGHTYISDWNNSRIRKVTYPYTFVTPSISLSGIISAPIGSSVVITAVVVGEGSDYLIRWFNHGVEFATTTIPSVTYTKGAGIDTVTARVVAACSYFDSTTSIAHIVNVGGGDGVAEISNAAEEWCVVYPSPARDEVTIQTSPGLSKGEEVLCISNLMGQLFDKLTMTGSGASNNKTTINISSLPPGMYILQVTDDEGRKVRGKFIKE